MRRRLVAVALAVTAMVALAFVIPLAGLVRELAESRALTAAERDAQLVARLVTIVAGSTGVENALDDLGLGDSLNGHPVSLIFEDGNVAGSPVPPEEDLTSAQSGAAGDSFVPGGAAVYVPVVSEAGTIIVRVFVTDSELRRNVARSWLVLGALGLALVGIGVLAADRLGRSLVKPVEDLSAAAQRLGAGDLEARVEPSGPAELMEVAGQFNELARRVDALLQEERELAADLSHRLRTPLTAARLDAESLAPGPDRDRLIDDLGALERAVDHSIREARRAGRQGEAGITDVAAAVEARAGFWEALAEEQGRPTEFRRGTGAALPVRVPAADLEAAVDAVIGNVFAHTPERSRYHITLESENGRVRIVVDDAGPGFPGEGVLERGASTVGSTGLGLDIARRTVEAAGGSLEARPGPLGGTSVTLELPLTGRAST